VVYDVLPEIRTQLHKTVFSNIWELTEKDMAAINFAIYKVVILAPTQPLAEDEFYENTNELQFIVHKCDDETMQTECLVSLF
jgi:hypothetical protein